MRRERTVRLHEAALPQPSKASLLALTLLPPDLRCLLHHPCPCAHLTMPHMFLRPVCCCKPSLLKVHDGSPLVPVKGVMAAWGALMLLPVAGEHVPSRKSPTVGIPWKVCSRSKLSP